MANTYIPISKTILTSSASTITLSSIPQTYTDLVVLCSLRSTYPGVYTNWVTMRVNNDGTQLYSMTYVASSAGTTSSSRFASASVSRGYPFYIDSDLNTANTFGNGEIYIPNYTSSTAKQISSTGVAEVNDTTHEWLMGSANLYTGTSAITSLVFFSNGGSFDAGSRIDLYGIKNN